VIIRNTPPIHLTYGLSVHPGETWLENLDAIRSAALAVRGRVAPDKPFGLALRLGHLAAASLSDPDALRAFKAFLSSHNLYVFSINGFPYGSFHSTAVKETVYQPDWQSDRRRDYTLLLSDILAFLLPEGTEGSVSTSPGSYKGWVKSEAGRLKMIGNMMDCAVHLHNIHERTGKQIHLGFEPEPDCLLETTDEAIAFFEADLAQDGAGILRKRLGCSPSEAQDTIRRHLGVCFDTCHMALQFEDLADSLSRFADHGILISKVQLSSALRAIYSGDMSRRLREFLDPVYLHQVKIADESGGIVSFRDLPDALAEAGRSGREWRVHFHVPLYFAGDGILETTSSELTEGFFQTLSACGCPHLEIETYTFNVLPEDLKTKGLVGSVVSEFEWVLERMGTSIICSKH